MADQLILFLFCTDRGQHPWIALGDLTGPLLRANLGTVAHSAGDARRRDQCVWLDDIGRPHYRVHVRCNRCGRHVQWRGEAARSLMSSLNDAGISRVDISQLPH